MRRIAFALACVTTAAGCRVDDRTTEASRRGAQQAGTSVGVVAFRVPSDSEVTDPDVLQSLQRGRALLRNTRDSLPRHVGNRLACVSCHAMDGTLKNAIPLVGVYARFPQYRSRSGRVDVIEDRVNDCFERSMNGRALDRASRDMRDIVTYLAFLSRGVPSGAHVDGEGTPPLEPLRGDSPRGAVVFASTCAVCHGRQGEGSNAAPPVWGPQSYNIGAGMSRLGRAAPFIHAVMPKNNPGSLTAQQAFDVAVYINSQPRPDFARKAMDWPRGDAPADVAYPTQAARARKPD